MSRVCDAELARGRLLTTKPLREYSGHSKDVLDLSWCPLNPCLLLSAGLDKKIILWNLNHGTKPFAIYSVPEPVTSVCFIPNVDLVMSSSVLLLQNSRASTLLADLWTWSFKFGTLKLEAWSIGKRRLM